MDLRATATLPCTAERARTELEVLDHYPAWLTIVQSVRPAQADSSDPGPAWWVDLGARIGPLRRTKRVRMARTAGGPDHVRFDRRQIDGRAHSAWVLEAQWEEEPGGAAATFLTVSLHYGGSTPVPLLEAVLGREVRKAADRLTGRVTDIQ